MSKKNKPNKDGIVYSTDSSFCYQEPQTTQKTPEPAKQQLRVRLDTKQRAGKAVTLVCGFRGEPEQLEGLGKKLKTYCGTGGSVKDQEVIIQGDQREKVMQWLLANGFSSAKQH